MDPNNHVVKLCVEGMRSEGEGRIAEARSLFLRAWEARQNDFEACIAAHYVARHQPSAAETLQWNQTALDYAKGVADDGNEEQVKDFYPSLYLNLGWSHEQLGEMAKAQYYYALAGKKADRLPTDRYGNIVREGVLRGQQRINDMQNNDVQK